MTMLAFAITSSVSSGFAVVTIMGLGLRPIVAAVLVTLAVYSFLATISGIVKSNCS